MINERRSTPGADGPGPDHDLNVGTRGGTADVDWVRVDGRLEVTVRVPVGTTALVALPGPAGKAIPGPARVGPGTHRFSVVIPAPAPTMVHAGRGHLSSAPARTPRGQITIGEGLLIMLATAGDEASLARVEEVLGSHLQRVRAAPGTRRRLDPYPAHT